MDTGNNTAGKTAPERYVSEKAFEELPDTFQKLAELLGEDQFELVAVNDEKDPQDQKAASESAFSEEMAEKPDDNIYRVDSYVKNGEIRLVYLMNDARKLSCFWKCPYDRCIQTGLRGRDPGRFKPAGQRIHPCGPPG